MDQIEEPMDIDTSVEIDDRMNESMTPAISINELNNANVLTQPETRYENRGGTFTTGIDIFSKEEKVKMEERARRFGLAEKLKNTTKDVEPELYSSMGITDEVESGQNLRLNVLHMRGTKEMSTKDVFKYFEDYAPASIEWINDVSCNVVWLDNVTAARALLGLSKKINGLGEKVRADKDIKSEKSSFDNDNDIANEDCIVEIIGEDGNAETEEKNENSINIKDIKCPLPPGLWRKGVDCPNSKSILLRFATRADKKYQNAEKMSEYYKKHGNPNFGGLKGILTESRKRMYKDMIHSKKRIKQENSNTDQSDRISKNPWGSLSQNWGVNDFTEDSFVRAPPINRNQVSNIKHRLGVKQQMVKEVPVHSEGSGNGFESESDDEDWCKRSKVMRMRMHADDEEVKVQKRRWQMKNQGAVHSNTSDLRSRLSTTRKTPVMYPGSIKVIVKNNQLSTREIPAPNNNLSEPKEAEEEEEEEEGEIVDEAESEYVVNEEWNEFEAESAEEDEEEEDDEELEKEVQGTRGSVIKVVQHKPRVASTVWARLNNKKPEEADTVKQRRPTKGDLRETLQGDLRSRLGKQTRGRSPLRIEVKNDKYGKEDSDSE